MVTGESLTYIGGRGHIDIPLATDLKYRDAHKPWCESCKRTEPLNDEGLCAECVKANEVRARLAEKRAQREAAAAATNPSPAPDVATVQPADPAPSFPRVDVQQASAGEAAPHRDGRAAKFDVDEAMRRYAAGEKAATIAADLGTTAQNIYGHANRRGIKSGQDKPAPEPPAPDVPTVRAKVTRAGTHDVVITLRSSTDPLSQVKVAALLTDLLQGLTPQKAKPKRPRPRRDRFPMDEVTRLYTDEQLTCPQIAEKLGISVVTTRRRLIESGITMRDDRATHSGWGHRNLKRRMDQLGVTSRQIKDWALEQGLITEILVGSPKAHLIEAYANAQRQENTDD